MFRICEEQLENDGKDLIGVKLFYEGDYYHINTCCILKINMDKEGKLYSITVQDSDTHEIRDIVLYDYYDPYGQLDGYYNSYAKLDKELGEHIDNCIKHEKDLIACCNRRIEMYEKYKKERHDESKNRSN